VAQADAGLFGIAEEGLAGDEGNVTGAGGSCHKVFAESKDAHNKVDERKPVGFHANSRAALRQSLTWSRSGEGRRPIVRFTNDL